MRTLRSPNIGMRLHVVRMAGNGIGIVGEWYADMSNAVHPNMLVYNITTNNYGELPYRLPKSESGTSHIIASENGNQLYMPYIISSPPVSRGRSLDRLSPLQWMR